MTILFFIKLIIGLVSVVGLSIIAEHVSPRVAGILVGFPTDTADVRDYIKKMRKRDKELNFYWGTNCPLLEMTAQNKKFTSHNSV